MSSDDVNKGRRRFLVATTSVVGGVGVGIAAVPFIKSWMPSARARAIGVPVEVNLAKLKEGQLLKVQWRGQTIGVLHRTQTMIDNLPKVDDRLVDPESKDADQPPYIHGETRGQTGRTATCGKGSKNRPSSVRRMARGRPGGSSVVCIRDACNAC